MVTGIGFKVIHKSFSTHFKLNGNREEFFFHISSTLVTMIKLLQKTLGTSIHIALHAYAFRDEPGTVTDAAQTKQSMCIPIFIISVVDTLRKKNLMSGA